MTISTKQSYLHVVVDQHDNLFQSRGLGEYAQSALLKTETGAVQCGARGLEVMMVMPLMVLVFYI